MIRVIVLLSSYNGEKYIKQQIDSILNQTGVEVIIMVRDDGSKDNTISILEDYQRNVSSFELIKGDNCGSTASFSRLLAYAYSKFGNDVLYAFSDQDDVWQKEKLLVASKRLDIKSTIPMLYCSNLTCVDEFLNVLKPMRNRINGFPKSSTLICPIATGCTMVFTPSAAELYVSSYTEKVRMHDIWLSQICAFLGSVYYDNDAYILYRQHGGNQIGNKSNIKDKLLAKYKSLKTLNSQHDRENDAKTFFKQFGNLLSPEDFEMVDTVASYKSSIKKRWRFFLAVRKGQLKRLVAPNFWLYIRIILGTV